MSDPQSDTPDHDDITDLVREFEASDRQRLTDRTKSMPDLSAFESDENDPYFRHSPGTPTDEVSALRPLSENVIDPVTLPPPANDDVALEPIDDVDDVLKEAVVTKRLPRAPRRERGEVKIEDLESVVANIPEASGSDTDVRVVLPQSRVHEDPGLIISRREAPTMAKDMQQGLLKSLGVDLSTRVKNIMGGDAGVPYGHGYYSLQSVGVGADIRENPSLVEVAFMALVQDDQSMAQWAMTALSNKCEQAGGIWHDKSGADPETPPGIGSVSALRDVGLAIDLLQTRLPQESAKVLFTTLHRNAKRIHQYINNIDNHCPANVSEAGAMALGMVGLPLMNFEEFYGDARRWVDSAEERACTLLKNRVAENGRPAASDLRDLMRLMRFLLPFTTAFDRYNHEDILMGDGGHLSQLPQWIAHQFGPTSSGLFASSRLTVDDLRYATPLLAKLGSTYRDGVAQWLLQQVSVADATNRIKDASGARSLNLRLPAAPGVDSVMTLAFFDSELEATSPADIMSTGARLSETRAIVRSNWQADSPVVSMQAEAGTLPFFHLSSQGVDLKLVVNYSTFEKYGGTNVVGRVKDYIDLGNAAYINGDYQGTDSSLAQRHVVYLRPEQTALLFDRFDLGDGRHQQRMRLHILGADSAEQVDRGTLGVDAGDGSGRSARFTFFSNGFSKGVLDGKDDQDPGLAVEFTRGRGDLASVIALGKPDEHPDVHRINVEERGRVYRATMGKGAVLFNGWPAGMPQQCGWLWTDALIAYTDTTDDYPHRYVAIKATSVLAYDMSDGIHLGFGASHPDDPDKPVEFNLTAGESQAVMYLSTRAHVRVAFPGLTTVFVDGAKVETEGDEKIVVISKPLEAGRHVIEFEYESPGPESRIASPEEGQLVGGTMALRAAIGSPIGVKEARLKINGQYYGETLTEGPWVWKVDTRSLAEGIHESVVESTDAEGHTRASIIRRFQVDNTPPSVQLQSPHDGKKTRGVLECEATADDENGVERVQFRINGKKIGDPVVTPPYRRDIDTTEIPDGTYELTAIAVDAAGNVGTSDVARLTIANDAPPPTIVKLKIIPPVLAIQPLQEVQLKMVAIDDEDGEHEVRCQWRRVKGSGVVDRAGVFTAPSQEGPCVMEAQVPGTKVRAKLHAVVEREA